MRHVVATARMVPRVSLPLTVILLLIAVLQPALGLGFMLAVGHLVAQIPTLVTGRESDALTALALVAGLYVAQQTVAAVADVAEWRLGRLLNNDLDERLLTFLTAPHGITHLEDARIRDLSAEVADGLGAGWWRPSKTPGALFNITSAGLGLAVTFGVAIWLEWWLGLLLAVVAVWALYAVIRHSLVMILGFTGTTGHAEFRRMEYERDVAVSPASAKEVRLFGFAPWVLARWEERLRTVLALDLKNIARVTPSVILSIVALGVVTAGGFAWAAIQAANGELGLGAATVLAQAVLAPLAHFGPTGQAVINLSLSSKPIRSLLELEQEIHAVPDVARQSHGGARESAIPAGTIRFENVSFRYPGTEVDVLRDFNLEIPAGTAVAVVGLNGAGKTTLVKLLCRFYEPTEGRITVDGRDIRTFEPSQWQRHVAAIFQDFARYPFSARDNVGFGDLSASRERIEHAVARAGATQVIETLPAGWGTVLSREFTGGTDLSGGQWQRIALARALLAADSGARVLILDEPAANLDVRAEADLNERFFELTTGVTTIVISHRFSTVRRADTICVVDDGRLVEHGSHDELMTSGGRYAELFRLQAERFAL